MEGREDEIVTDTLVVYFKGIKKKKWVEVGSRIMKAVLQQTYNRKSSISSFKAALKLEGKAE